MITPLDVKSAPALRVAPEKAPLGVARRFFLTRLILLITKNLCILKGVPILEMYCEMMFSVFL